MVEIWLFKCFRKLALQKVNSLRVRRPACDACDLERVLVVPNDVHRDLAIALDDFCHAYKFAPRDVCVILVLEFINFHYDNSVLQVPYEIRPEFTARRVA